jgi:hypothetical protein
LELERSPTLEVPIGVSWSDEEPRLHLWIYCGPLAVLGYQPEDFYHFVSPGLGACGIVWV